MENTDIILGSGDLYLTEYSGTLPDDNTIETEENSVGHISGGASLEYKPELYEVISDKNVVLKRFVTNEEVTFKSGVLTFNVDMLEKLSTGSVTSTATTKTIKIGGAKSMTSYLLQFVHTKDDGKKLRIQMIATASDGFVLTFAKDKETVVDAVFKALSQTDGTLVTIKDEIGASVAEPLTFICTDGTTENTTQIESVVPALTAGNSYMYKFNVPVPSAGADITGLGWLPYTLGADIHCANNDSIPLVEV